MDVSSTVMAAIGDFERSYSLCELVPGDEPAEEDEND